MIRSPAAILLALLQASSVAAHGNLLKAVINGQTACAFNAPGNSCSGAIKMRKLIPRSGNDGACAIPPGCELGCAGVTGALPGAGAACASQGVCDHCALEKTAAEKGIVGGDGSKWWTKKPAAHWDEPDQWPKFACMSRDAFGARGTASVSPGDTITTTTYINADHSGLYRFELGCGRGDVSSVAGNSAMNTAFNAEPITPWKALHVSKELGGATPLPASREVGSTRAETDAWWGRTTCTAAGCPYRMNGAAPQYPGGAYDIGSAACEAGPNGNPGVTCYIQDSFTIPSTSSCRGDAVLRWFWNSAEGEETYANCLDINIAGAAVGGGSGGSPGGGASPGAGASPGGSAAEQVSTGPEEGGMSTYAIIGVLFAVAVVLSVAFWLYRRGTAGQPPPAPAAGTQMQVAGAASRKPPGPPPPAGLPAGWTEVADPASGKNYFYNQSTGETTWTRPAGRV